MKNLGRILVATLLLTSNAWAVGPRFALGPVAGWTNVDVDTKRADEINQDSSMSWGGLFLIEAPIDQQFGIESGVIFVNRKFTIGNNTVQIERTVPTLYVPLEFRAWAGSILSLAGGGFAAIKVGDVTDKVKSGSDTLATFSQNNRDGTEYGLTAAITVNLAGPSKSGLYIEGRYMHGLSDNGRAGFYEEKIRDVLFSAGFRFGTDTGSSQAAPASAGT